MLLTTVLEDTILKSLVDAIVDTHMQEHKSDKVAYGDVDTAFSEDQDDQDMHREEKTDIMPEDTVANSKTFSSPTVEVALSMKESPTEIQKEGSTHAKKDRPSDFVAYDSEFEKLMQTPATLQISAQSYQNFELFTDQICRSCSEKIDSPDQESASGMESAIFQKVASSASVNKLNDSTDALLDCPVAESSSASNKSVQWSTSCFQPARLSSSIEFLEERHTDAPPPCNSIIPDSIQTRIESEDSPSEKEVRSMEADRPQGTEVPEAHRADEGPCIRTLSKSKEESLHLADNQLPLAPSPGK